MWIRIIGCILIIILCYLAGIIYSNIYRDRVKELESFEKIIHEFENQINYVLAPIPEIVAKLKYKLSNPLKAFLISFEENLALGSMSMQAAWEKALENNKGKFSLNNDDYDTIIWFGNQLGISDKETQIKNIQFTLEKLKNQRVNAEKEKEKNGKLYKSLGLAMGVFIAIIII